MIQYKTIDGLLLRDMAVAGSALLEKNRELVDALNVFPVPDGDTGTNMSLTMQSAVREVSAKELLRAEAEAAGAVTLEPSIEEITPPETRFTEAYQDFLEAGAAIGRSGIPEVPEDAETPEEAPETPAE